MTGFEGDWIERFKSSRFEAEKIPAFDDKSLETIRLFIEKNPQVINSLEADTASAKNLLDNLELISEKNPFSKSPIAKIKLAIENILVGTNPKDFFSRLDRCRNLSPLHQEELMIQAMTLMAGEDKSKLYDVQSYGILDEKDLIAIAKIIARNAPTTLSRNIRDFKIASQRDLIEIAEIAAATDGGGLSEYIQNYEIKDLEALIRIAKIAAAENGEDTSDCIENYGIEDQAALVAIAKIAAGCRRKGVSKYIGRYGILDEKGRIEIAKIAAAQPGSLVSMYIENYGIKDQAALIEIAELVICVGPLEVLEYLDKFLVEPKSDSSIYKCLLLTALAYGALKIPTDSLEFFSSFEKLGAFLSNDMSAQEKRRILKEASAKDFFKSCAAELEKELALDFIKVSPLKQALVYRNREIGYALIAKFILGCLSQKYLAAYVDLAGDTVTPRLASIIPAKWAPAPGSDPEKLLAFFKEFKHDLKHKDTGLMQLYLLTAESLDSLQGTFPERKLELLSSACSQKDLQGALKGLGYLYAFSVKGEAEVLNALKLEDLLSNFKSAFKEMLSKDSLLDIADIKNFDVRYMEVFDSMRVPLALEVYKAKMATLRDEAIVTTVKRFVRSALLGTFAKERARTDINPHLSKIKEHDSELLDRWEAFTFSAPVESISIQQGQLSFSFRSFFERKLKDGHWNVAGQDLLPDLTSYLEGKTIEDPSNKVLMLCRELVEQESLPEEDQRKIIQSILKELRSLPAKKIEFENDLNGLIKAFSSPSKETLGERVSLSKEWEDLFLSGTEVAGSCQRVDGDPDKNKCLLAYCLDGKNAMVAVKNQEGNLQARSMLRLLWNEKEQKPALFLDRFYPDPSPDRRKAAIVHVATECAKELNCDLFTTWDGYPKALDTTIQSLGSSCPYEYADAAEGVMEGGIFKIINPGKIYLAT